MPIPTGLSPGVPINALEREDLSNEATRAALKALDPRYYDQYYMLPSRISHTDIPLGATSSAPGMSDIWHGSRTSTMLGLPPVSEVGFATGPINSYENEYRLLTGNAPYVYATTEPDISKMLAEREGRPGTVIKGQVPTESLRGAISTVPGAFGGDPRYPGYKPETEAFIRSRGFDPRMPETEFLLTPENANIAFGFEEGTAKVEPRARVGPIDLGQTAKQQFAGARVPLYDALMSSLPSGKNAITNILGVEKEYAGGLKDFLPGIKQKAITGVGKAARLLGPASIPLDLIAANQYFSEGAPARGLAALGSTVFPPALAVEAALNVGAGVQDAARQAGEYLTSPDQEIRAEDRTLTNQMADYIAARDNNMAQPYVSHSGREYSEGFPITPGAGFTAEIPFLGDYTVQPEQLGLTPELMDDLIAYNDKLARLSKHDPLYRETGIGQPAVDLGPGIPDQYHTLGGQLTAEFSPLPTEDLVSQARWYQRASEPWTFGYGRDADANVQGIMMGRGGFRPATGIIDDAIRENILQIPEYTPSVQGWRPGLRGRASITDPGAVGDESMASTRRNPWRDIVKRVLSPVSTSLDVQASRFPVGYTGDTTLDTITENLGVNPYTSITTLPIGEEGWTPTLLAASDTLGGPEIGTDSEEQTPFILDQGYVDPYISTTALPWDTLGGPEVGEEPTAEAPTVEALTAEAPIVEAPTAEEPVTKERVEEIKKKPREDRTSVEEQVIVASEVQNALANAAAGKPVQENLKAIAALSKIDPTIAKRYTTPGSQDLIDITSQVESLANIPTVQPGAEKPWTPPAPAVPDISQILKTYVPPAKAQTPAVDDFSSMFTAPKPKPKPKGKSQAQKRAEDRARAADKRAADRAAAADKRAADRAAAARERDIAKAARAARAAEKQREAATKKAAEEQRRKDAEAQKIWEKHKKWAADNAKMLREREANRLKQMGYKKPVTGSQFIYT